MDEVIFTKTCPKLGRPSLLHPTGTVCWLGVNPLAVISETELHLTDTGTMKVLVMNAFPHKPLSQGQGKIDYARSEMTWFGRSIQITHYSDSLPTTVSVHDSCGHPCIDEVMRQYTDVFEDDLSNFSHCNLILLTVNVNGHEPTRQRAYRKPLPKRKVVDDQVGEMPRTSETYNRTGRGTGKDDPPRDTTGTKGITRNRHWRYYDGLRGARLLTV